MLIPNSAPFYYDELKKIDDIDKYYEETQKLVDAVKQKNDDITELWTKIAHLGWNNSIEYDGVKYGVPEWHQGIHRGNDCYGKVVLISEYANEGLDYYKCEKCGKEDI